MNILTLALVVFSVILAESLVGATYCKPFSKFSIFCDICECGEDGTTYSCNVDACELASADKKYENVEVPFLDDEIPSHYEVDNEFSDDGNYVNRGHGNTYLVKELDEGGDIDPGLIEYDRRKRHITPLGKPSKRYIKPKRFINPGNAQVPSTRQKFPE